MPRRPIYKHAGINVRVEKEKEGKKGAKKATAQQASKQFCCYPEWGMRQKKKKNIFVPLPQKGYRARQDIIDKHRNNWEHIEIFNAKASVHNFIKVVVYHFGTTIMHYAPFTREVIVDRHWAAKCYSAIYKHSYVWARPVMQSSCKHLAFFSGPAQCECCKVRHLFRAIQNEHETYTGFFFFFFFFFLIFMVTWHFC